MKFLIKRFSLTFVVACGLALIFLGAVSQAEVDGPDVIDPPSSVLDDGATNDHQQAFNEAQGVFLTSDIQCDNGTTLAAGQLVNSHMIFLNTPEGSADMGDQGVTWEFHDPIRCVMSDKSGELEAESTAPLGASGTVYPGSSESRGLEPSYGDSYSIGSADKTITVDMSVTAEFGDWIRVVTGKSLSHSKCYPADGEGSFGAQIGLRDQFGEFPAQVQEREHFCAPVKKNDEEVPHEDQHLTFYRLDSGFKNFPKEILVRNQFGEQSLNLTRLQSLAVPTAKFTDTGEYPLSENLSHFTCYGVKGEAPRAVVNLEDQFHVETDIKIGEPALLCNPAAKEHGVKTREKPKLYGSHLVCYDIGETTDVVLKNQFGEEKLSVGGGKRLCVPSEKIVPPKPGTITIKKETDPSGVDVDFDFTMDGSSFTLGDGDGANFPGLSPGNYTVTETIPSGWNLENISCTSSATTSGNSVTIDLDSGEHVTCTFENKRVPLDHFKCYDAGMTLPYEVDIDLRDQFGEFKARVKEKERFCNPVSKNGGDILDEDHHLAFYRLVSGFQEFPSHVDVSNQFGEQRLKLTRLQSLAVPTRKLVPGDHPKPESLDHFACYRVEGEAPNEFVNLVDQFHKELKVRVGEPTLLCNPTAKTHGNIMARIQHPEAHLVCYRLGETFPITMENQFEKDQLLIGGGKRLCVPSEKKIYVPSEKEE